MYIRDDCATWLSNRQYNRYLRETFIDCNNKSQSLKKRFNNTRLSIIYLTCLAMKIFAKITAEVNEDIAEPIAVIGISVDVVKISYTLL